MALHPVTATAPSAWASYLISGDESGLASGETAIIDEWLTATSGGLSPIGCEDAGFIQWHDAFAVFPYDSDCQTYTFLIESEESEESE